MARMVLRSGVANRLVTQGMEVVVISPNADELYFQEECLQEGVILKPAPQMDGIAIRIADRFGAYRPYFLDDVMNNIALHTKHKRRFSGSPFLEFTMALINRKFTNFPMFQEMYRYIEYFINRSKILKDFLLDINPDMIVLPNIFGTYETMYLIYALDLEIPTVCQVLSWDNITSKGTPLFMPEYFISWGPIMTKEIADIYSFPREKIYECGVPHFDVYFQKNRFIPRSTLVKELNLQQEAPSIFYAMVSPYSCPNELEILVWLADKINNDGFTTPCSLVIRPHPQTIRGMYARDSKELERIGALAGPRVAVDIPPVLSDRLAWDLPKTDMYRLASLLSGSAMCLTAGSTLSLEACILDCPVITIGFDGGEELPYDISARRGLDYTHIAKFLALRGARVARTFCELEEHINAYLKNPYLDQEGRALSAAQECGPQDGRAAECVANTLLALVQLHRDRDPFSGPPRKVQPSRTKTTK